MSFLDFFKKSKQNDDLYELVENEIDDDVFRQGIRILHKEFKDVIVTIDPKVQVIPNDDKLVIKFDFDVVSNPNKIDIDKKLLHPIVGDIIVDLMKKDYA
jgi:hypothetical protein